MPVDLVKDLYDNVSKDEYKKYKALVVKAGITGAIAYLTGTASSAVVEKAVSVGFGAQAAKMSESALNVLLLNVVNYVFDSKKIDRVKSYKISYTCWFIGFLVGYSINYIKYS